MMVVDSCDKRAYSNEKNRVRVCINVRISIRREVNTKTLNIISDKKESKVTI